MRRRLMAAVAVAVMVVLWAATALAGEIEVRPGTVPQPGLAEFDLGLSDFDADTPVFVVPCAAPASGDIDDIDADTCDIEQVVAARTDADGRADVQVTLDVPAEGIAFLAGNEARTDAASALVEVTPTAVLGAQEPAPTPTPPAGTTLAETGARQSLLLAAIASTLVAAGLVSRAAGRRLGPVTVST